MKIEDYAFLSDTQTGALVGTQRFVRLALLSAVRFRGVFRRSPGRRKNGRWLFKPTEEITATRRRYIDGTLILETEIETPKGVVRLIDFMPPRGENPDIVRIIEGVRGDVEMKMELIVRFDYGRVVPWVRKRDGALEMIAGPDALVLRTPIKTHGEDLTTVAEFTVAKGDRIPFVLTWFASHKKAPRAINPEHALRDTTAYWEQWAQKCEQSGEWQ